MPQAAVDAHRHLVVLMWVSVFAARRPSTCRHPDCQRCCACRRALIIHLHPTKPVDVHESGLPARRRTSVLRVGRAPLYHGGRIDARLFTPPPWPGPISLANRHEHAAPKRTHAIGGRRWGPVH